MSQPHPRLVVVEWDDITVADDSTWVTIKDAKAATPMRFLTCGWLIAESPDHLVLTDTLGSDLMGPRTVIPRGVVRKMTVVLKAALPRAKAKT